MAIAKLNADFLESLSRAADGGRRLFWKEYYGQYVSPLVCKFVRENYEAGGRPRKWEPLTAKYLRQKENKGFRRGILIRTGALLRGVTSETTSVVRGNRLIIKPVGRAAGLAAIHSHGRGGKFHMVARPVMQLTIAQKTEIRAAMRKLKIAAKRGMNDALRGGAGTVAPPARTG